MIPPFKLARILFKKRGGTNLARARPRQQRKLVSRGPAPRPPPCAGLVRTPVNNRDPVPVFPVSNPSPFSTLLHGSISALEKDGSSPAMVPPQPAVFHFMAEVKVRPRLFFILL
jgi:hypothetical protein